MNLLFIAIGAFIGVACGKLLDKAPVRTDLIAWALVFALGTYIILSHR